MRKRLIFLNVLLICIFFFNSAYAQIEQNTKSTVINGKPILSFDTKTGVGTSLIFPKNTTDYINPCKTYQGKSIGVVVEVDRDVIDYIPLIKYEDKDDYHYYEPFFTAAVWAMRAVCPRVVFCHNIFDLRSPNGNRELCEESNEYSIFVRGTYKGAQLSAYASGDVVPNPLLFIGTVQKNKSGAWQTIYWSNRNLASYRDDVKRAMDAKRKQQAEIQANQLASQARNSERTAFSARYNVVEYMQAGTLAVNAYPYKGKVVGIPTWFVQMVAENEAVFGNGMRVGNVPPDLFRRSGMVVVLAMKVKGFQQATMQPYGDFEGVYLCQRQNCEDFFDRLPQ